MPGCDKEYIKPWSPYDTAHFRYMHHHDKRHDDYIRYIKSVNVQETRKLSEIRNNLGILRFTVSFTSYIPS